MCGIIATKGLQTPFHHGLLQSLRKRGPDAIGFWSHQEVQIAHTRLSIIGLDERGTQPMQNERFVISFNGEIYNFIELREQLAQSGVRFDTSTDTEVLLHGWSLWGPEVLKKLDGFWAFVLYDKQLRTLILVRDQLGIKPLYYFHSPELTSVSSLLKTVLETMGDRAELDYQGLSEYVRYQFTFGEKTFIRQIKKVLAGHYVTIDLHSGELKSVCYEDILKPAGEEIPYSPQLIRETRDLVAQCSKDSTISDTSFTTFCSGGLDSSLITAVTDPDVAYHCNYTDPDCNETFFAKQAIQNKHTRLMVVNAQETFDIIERLDDIISDFDEPTIGSVILPLDDLLKQVKRRYKVILTGTGGDELYAGYVRYQLALGECYQNSYRMMYEKMEGVTDVAARFEMTHRKGNTGVYRFYEPATEQTFFEHYEQCHYGVGDLHAMLTFDRRYFLAGLLNIDDKMCGRHSLESRPSFLHQKMVRHAVRIAPDAQLRNAELKHLLREAAADYLPQSVIRRNDKMGFTTPIGTFINQSAHLIREQVTGSRFASLYNLKHMNFTAETKFSREVFGLLMLDLWLNRYAKRA